MCVWFAAVVFCSGRRISKQNCMVKGLADVIGWELWVFTEKYVCNMSKLQLVKLFSPKPPQGILSKSSSFLRQWVVLRQQWFAFIFHLCYEIVLVSYLLKYSIHVGQKSEEMVSETCNFLFSLRKAVLQLLFQFNF